jgi:hypothetical protein
MDHYSYSWKLFSVLLTALFFACCCYGCITFWCKRSSNNYQQFSQESPLSESSRNITPPPYYQNDKQNNKQNNTDNNKATDKHNDKQKY